jgi:hypothetical protein
MHRYIHFVATSERMAKRKNKELACGIGIKRKEANLRAALCQK